MGRGAVSSSGRKGSRGSAPPLSELRVRIETIRKIKVGSCPPGSGEQGEAGETRAGPRVPVPCGEASVGQKLMFTAEPLQRLAVFLFKHFCDGDSLSPFSFNCVSQVPSPEGGSADLCSRSRPRGVSEDQGCAALGIPTAGLMSRCSRPRCFGLSPWPRFTVRATAEASVAWETSCSNRRLGKRNVNCGVKCQVL